MQKRLLTDYIKVVDDALKPELCDQFIRCFNHTQYERVETDTYQFDVINLNTTPGLQEVAYGIAEKAAIHAETYFDELGLSIKPSIQGFEEIRLKRYSATDQFKEHIDVDDYASARRYLICMFYLNDLDDGQTVFEGLDIKIKPKQGRLVMFPPTWMFPHAGTPIANGEKKYTIATSLHYL